MKKNVGLGGVPVCFYLTIDEGKLKVQDEHRKWHILMTAKDLVQFLSQKKEKYRANVDLMCSSSIDFPEEFTKDQDVIRLCNQIRGA